MSDNPMPPHPRPPTERLQAALRCHAKARTTGQPCKGPAVRGWTVCRMHGARGGAPSGQGNGMWRHGGRTQEANETGRMIADLARIAKAGLNDLNS